MNAVQKPIRLTITVVIIALVLPVSLALAEGRGNGGSGGGGSGSTTSPTYDVIELGPINNRPTAISPAGADDEIVWVAGNGAEGYVAAVYSVYSRSTRQVVTGYLPEPRTPLNGGPGSELYGETFNRASFANSVNASGHIAGGCDYYDPDATLREYSEFRATLWLNTNTGYQRVDLGVADTGHNYSDAGAINDDGMVVGTSALLDFGNEGFETYYRAFVWDSDNGMVDLNDLLPPATGWELQFANGINSSGKICGEGLLNGVTRAFVFDLNTHAIAAVPMLLGGLENNAVAINDLGHVTGSTTLAAVDAGGHPLKRGFLWTGSAPIELPPISGQRSFGNAVNSSDEVVGYSYDIPENQFVATLWDPLGGSVLALENEVPTKPKWELMQAGNDINEQGWIVTYGRKTYRGTVSWEGAILVPRQ